MYEKFAFFVMRYQSMYIPVNRHSDKPQKCALLLQQTLGDHAVRQCNAKRLKS